MGKLKIMEKLKTNCDFLKIIVDIDELESLVRGCTQLRGEINDIKIKKENSINGDIFTVNISVPNQQNGKNQEHITLYMNDWQAYYRTSSGELVDCTDRLQYYISKLITTEYRDYYKNNQNFQKFSATELNTESISYILKLLNYLGGADIELINEILPAEMGEFTINSINDGKHESYEYQLTTAKGQGLLSLTNYTATLYLENGTIIDCSNFLHELMSLQPFGEEYIGSYKAILENKVKLELHHLTNLHRNTAEYNPVMLSNTEFLRRLEFNEILSIIQTLLQPIPLPEFDALTFNRGEEMRFYIENINHNLFQGYCIDIVISDYKAIIELTNNSSKPDQEWDYSDEYFKLMAAKEFGEEYIKYAYLKEFIQAKNTTFQTNIPEDSAPAMH